MTTLGWITILGITVVIVMLIWSRDYTNEQKNEAKEVYKRHILALESCIDNLKKARSEAKRDGEEHMVEYYEAEIQETKKTLYEIMERMDNL